MRVLVVGGGISSEREVSLRSAQAIYDTLIEGKEHEPYLYDWDGTENWLLQNVSKFDVVFPALHGEGGEDGTIQKILEKNNCAFVGSGSSSSKNCIDKTKTKDVLRQNNIRVPDGKSVSYQEYLAHRLYNLPHVLKPSIGGSSIDTFIFPSISSRIDEEIEQAFTRHKYLLVEEYIIGTEITCPILIDRALPVIEIIPPKNATFDFENKYNGMTQELCPPENVNGELQAHAQEIAQKVHKIMGCRHLSRTDMIINDRDIIVLEINTMPGFTLQSLFPKSAKIAGISMAEVVDSLINAAYKDKTIG